MFVKGTGKPIEILTKLNELAGFAPDEEIEFFELISGVTSDLRQDDQPEFHIRPDMVDDKSSTREYLISFYKKNLYPAVKDEIQQCLLGPANTRGLATSRSSEIQWITSWWLQFKVLLSRGLKERKYESYSGLRIFQRMCVVCLLLLLFGKKSDLLPIQCFATFFYNTEANGGLFSGRWFRVVLDEAHTIKSSKSQVSMAACALAASSMVLYWNPQTEQLGRYLQSSSIFEG